MRVIIIAVSVLLLAVPARAQQRGQAGPPPTARANAPIDMTGYWVSIVSEDWRIRMLTPQKNDFPGIPLNAAARQVAAAWDPAKDEAAGEQCKGYAAPHIMREPGRLNITWENDDTLRMDIDSGTQTRLFRFGNPPPAGARTWQGHSVAAWRPAAPPARGARPNRGSLKVTTSQIRPGYIRKNGVPFSENLVMDEYFDIITAPNGDQWLIVTTRITDPQYLANPFVFTTQFRKEPNGSKWNPTPCSAR
jgi:hypothetical protein